jgi:hypothetical protein
MDIHTYELPNPMWQWVSNHFLSISYIFCFRVEPQPDNWHLSVKVNKDWLADMTGDVDESGWEYAFRFRQSTWHGN